jgi:hypothetical protein
MASVYDGLHNRRAQEYTADKNYQSEVMRQIGQFGTAMGGLAGQGATSKGNVGQAALGAQSNAFDRYAGGLGAMTGDFMRGNASNFGTFTQGTSDYGANLANLGQIGGGMYNTYNQGLSNLYNSQTAENVSLANAATQPYMAAMTAAGNIGSAGLGATGAAANAALGSNASMLGSYQNMLGLNSQGANQAYGTIGATRNQGAANIAQAMGGVGQEALRARGQMMTGAAGALEGMTRGIADMRSNIGANTALADANLGGALATATGTISAGASPFTQLENRFRQNNSGSSQRQEDTGYSERDSGTTRRAGTEIDIGGLFSGLFGGGYGGAPVSSSSTTITGPGGEVIGSGGFSPGTTGVGGGGGGGANFGGMTRKFDDTDQFDRSRTQNNRFFDQESFDTGTESYSKGPSQMLRGIVDDSLQNLRDVGSVGFSGIDRSRQMADDMSPFDRGYSGIDRVMNEANDFTAADQAYANMGGALQALYDNPANSYVQDTFDTTRFDGRSALDQGIAQNRSIYDQTLFDINNQVASGYGNLQEQLAGVPSFSRTDASPFLGRMDAGYAAGLQNLDYLSGEMAARQNMLAPMYDDSNRRMANAYGIGLGSLESGYGQARQAIDSTASGAYGQVGAAQAAGQGAMQGLFDTTIGDLDMFQSPEEQGRRIAARKYAQRRANVEERDKYNDFMRRRRERRAAGRL